MRPLFLSFSSVSVREPSVNVRRATYVRMRRVVVSLVLGVLCGTMGMYSMNRLSKEQRPLEQPREPPFTVLGARWPQVLAEMSAEFDRQVVCKDAREIRLLVVVLSTPSKQGAELRKLARNSIYKNLSSNVTVRFVIGTKAVGGTDLSDLKKEQRKFRDLTMLSDLKEEYAGLARKVQATIQWSNKHQFDYLIKTDDDVILLVDNMLDALKDLGCPRDLFYGHFYSMKKVVRKNYRWMNPNWYICETYLPYCAGLGYVLGRQVVDALAKYGDNFKHTRLEDSTLGLWLAPFRITRKNDDDRFALGMSCAKNTIVSHQFKLNNFRKTTENLIKTGSLCTE